MAENGENGGVAGGGRPVVGSRERYERLLAGEGEPLSSVAGPVCPRLRAPESGKGCVHFVKGGTCRLIEAFLCVEYMRKRGFDDARVRDACAELLRVPIDRVGEAPKVERSPVSGSDSGEKVGRGVTIADQGRIVALMKATEADIAAMEAIDFRAVLDVPHLDGVEIVNQYRPTGTRQLSIRHALLLAAVTACFPGATVSQLKIKRQPKAAEG